MFKAIDEAPEAVRDRFAAWRKARSNRGPDQAPVRAGDVGLRRGARARRPELKAAEMLWKARDLVRDYLPGRRAGRAAASGCGARRPRRGRTSPASTDMVRRLESLTRIVQLMPPPLHDDATQARQDAASSRGRRGRQRAHRVRRPAAARISSAPQLSGDRRAAFGHGPDKALDEWEAEAARRGYILIAPEYSEPGKPAEYRYTTSEHAAVELALRDARKRYAIDSDRVFAAGQLVGGNMAWDLCPGPSRLVRRRGRHLGAARQVRAAIPAASRAAAAVLRDR